MHRLVRVGAAMQAIGLSVTTNAAPQIIDVLTIRGLGVTHNARHTQVALSLQIQEDRMHHITLSSLAVFSAICLLYVLVVLAILQFGKVAKLKPNPPKSSTLRVELTISAPAPTCADPDKSKGTCVTTTFVFADELARTVTDFLAGYNSPGRSDLLEFLQQTGGPIAALFITQHDDNHVRNLTLLGEDAEKVLSFLTHCFNCQLASGTDDFHNEPASLSA
jgi:hypothetical protein